MSHPAQSITQLTEKEKETLRLIVRGHDAKSAANELGLSVHTINERLRAARRKLDVTSSREAARLLLESEGDAIDPDPDNLAYKHLGDASDASVPDPRSTTRKGRTPALWIGGAVIMSTLALVIAVSMSASPTLPETPSQPAFAAQPDAETLDGLEDIARDWLALVDAQQWSSSHAAGAQVFREFVEPQDFGTMVSDVRDPLGAVVERRLDTFASVSGPPGKFRTVIFATDFAGRKGVKETVTLVLDDGDYKVSGYWIDADEKVAANGTTNAADREREGVARRWLKLVDRSDWQASYDATGSTFRKANDVAGWRSASEQARVPLGELISRKAVTFTVFPSPEQYEFVRFETDFANKSGVIESITMVRENGELKVVGYYLD